MSDTQPPRSKDPLQGVTLEHIVTRLQAHYGWAALGALIDIRCFKQDPSIKSSLTFLRRTPWARSKVEELYRTLALAGRFDNTP
ncbi:MAG TPA: VF530 family protein [Cellvibrionaceae bacterium]|nr:VF530 family protein [Cellvibrionaceae bacterium]